MFPHQHSSEYADPVPVPPHEFADSNALCVVAAHPDLFYIVTPINVDRFEVLLQDHPNQPFVYLVRHALHEGFWPWADTSDLSYPSISDNSMKTSSKTDEQIHFIHDQLHEEIHLG